MAAKQQRTENQQQADFSAEASSSPASFQQPRGNAAMAEQIRLATEANGETGPENGQESEVDDVQPTSIIGVPVLYRRTAPTVGIVADLASPDGAASLAVADWVHIPANPSVWISLMGLESTDHEALTEALTVFCTTEGFDPSTSFHMKDGSIILGQPTTHHEFDANTASAQTVLNDSNDISEYAHQPDKAIFDYLNEGHTELNREDVSDELRVGHKQTPDKEKKPASWYNGYEIDGDSVVANTSPLDKRKGKDHPEKMPLAEYQEMLTRDFDFNDGIKRLKSLGGESAFTEAMAARFAKGHKLGAEAFKALCHEIWAYATTGMGSDKTTDIAKMQGMLRQLSPDIQESSDSNNPSGTDFEIPGTNVSIPQSDGKHGRATVLETRHLLAGLMAEPIPAQSIALKTLDDDEFKHTTLLVDISGSMRNDWELIQMYVNQVVLGKTTVGAIRSFFDGIGWTGQADLDDEQLNQMVNAIAGARSSEKSRLLEDWFGPPGGPGREESSVHMALQVLGEMENDPDNFTDDEQIVCITDEQDCRPDELRKLHEKANALSVLVKVIFMTNNPDTGVKQMLEININALRTETLDAIEQACDDARDRGPRYPYEGNIGNRLTRLDNDDPNTAGNLNGDPRSNTAGVGIPIGNTWHYGMEWKTIAEMQPDVTPVSMSTPRTSRRQP